MGLKGVKVGGKWYFSSRQVDEFFEKNGEDLVDPLSSIDLD